MAESELFLKPHHLMVFLELNPKFSMYIKDPKSWDRRGYDEEHTIYIRGFLERIKRLPSDLKIVLNDDPDELCFHCPLNKNSRNIPNKYFSPCDPVGDVMWMVDENARIELRRIEEQIQTPKFTFTVALLHQANLWLQGSKPP